MRNALVKMGHSPAEAKRIQEEARKMMDDYRNSFAANKYPPLKGTDTIPYVPSPTVPPAPAKK